MRLSRTLLATAAAALLAAASLVAIDRHRAGGPLLGARRHRADPPRHDDVHRRCPVHRQLRLHRRRRQRLRRVRRPLRRQGRGHRHQRLQRRLRPAGHPGRPSPTTATSPPRAPPSATARWPTARGSPSTRSAPPTPTPAPTTTWPWSRSTPPTSPRSTPRSRSGAARPASTPTAPRPATVSGPTATRACAAALAPLSPHTGISLGDDAADGGWSHPLYTVTPGIPGDSGSAFVSAGGKAIGTLSTLGLAPLPASNNIGDLAKELAFAQAHSGHLRSEAGERHRAVQPDPLIGSPAR